MSTNDATPRRGRWSREARRVTACAAALLAGYAGWFLLDDPDPRISTVVTVVISFAATAAAVMTMRAAAGPLRAPWAAVVIATTGGTIGIGVWAVSRLVGFAPVPPLTYATYLLFPLGMGTAALLFLGVTPHSVRYRTILDGVIMGAAMLIVSWLMVLRHVYADTERGSDLVLSLAYPIADVVALTVAAAVLVRAPAGARPTLTLLTLGLLCMALVEAVFAYATLGGDPIGGQLFELGWTAGMTAVLLAAWIGRNAAFDLRPGEVAGWASVLLPYGPLTLAATVMAIQPFSVVQEAPVLLAGLVLIPAVLVRQIVAVAENNRLIATANRQARHDPLTGLANRALFAERLTELLEDGEETGSVTVIVIDLDGFKSVNDNHGHAVGDDLLVAVANRLRAGVDDATTVARLGGDEFALLTCTSPEGAERLADRQRELFETPFVVNGRRFTIRAGVGLAVAGPTPISAAELVKRADLNMYATKRGRYGQERAAGSPALLAQLHSALDDAAFTMVYQPKLDVRSSKVAGVEALLRWPHPEHGLLIPGQFFELVRGAGLMEAVNDVALHLVLADARRWQDDGFEVPVAVNVFAPTLADRGMPERVAAALSSHGLRPNILTLELTEDLPMGRVGPTKQVLGELRASGVRISIDDFGAGYSTLSYLCHLPIDEVKLDRAFLEPVLTDKRAESVVRMTVALARDLDLTTVAEGVADARTLRRLTELGVDVAQGDHVGVPVFADGVPALFAARPVAP